MESNLRSTLEAERDNLRANLERVERWLSELEEAEPQSGEANTNGEQRTNRTSPKGMLAEHHVATKSVVEAAKEVLRFAGRALSSHAITEQLQAVGYNFGNVAQPVKSVGKALRSAANRGEISYNEQTGNYLLREG